MTYSGTEKKANFMQEVPARAIKDTTVPVRETYFALRFG